MIAGSTAEAELSGLHDLYRSGTFSPVAPITAEEHARRIDRAREKIDRLGAAALIVNAGASLRYFTGVSWNATERLVALVLPVAGEPFLTCPTFEKGSLEAELALPLDLHFWQEDEDPHRLVAQALPAGRHLAVDPSLPFHHAERLRDLGVDLISGAGIIDGCRMIKSPAELALMARAKTITLEVHRRAARILAPGLPASEVKRFIDAGHRALGASGSSFCAVQFGRATAFPHGLPGDQTLEENQLVLIDTGCTVEGYHSDITRTYAFGQVTQEIRDLWDLEKAAQAAAFAAVEPGVTCEEIDRTARQVLEGAGLGPDYALPGLPHRTGHGIGLSIHEPAWLVRGDTTPLEPGMCFSNEPMIVIPERFGIRLEDHFHVTPTGAEWFTKPQHSIDHPFA